MSGYSIIAITGLAGHAIGSWTMPNGRMWLRDVLPDDVPNARILTYGYDSRLADSIRPFSTMQDLAEEFLVNLVYMREMTEQVCIGRNTPAPLSLDTDDRQGGQRRVGVVLVSHDCLANGCTAPSF
jgi:hypothetical protein